MNVWAIDDYVTSRANLILGSWNAYLDNLDIYVKFGQFGSFQFKLDNF